MRVIVIGNGPIGSAAARHLAEAGHEVLLIGAAEPADKPAHRGVFSSHYDEARIARVLDTSDFWTRVKGASMARFAALEAASGIRFFHQTGAMMTGSASGARIAKARARLGLMARPAEDLDDAALAARFPGLAFPSGTTGFHEGNGSGWVNPRHLIAAQNHIAKAAGARLLTREVTALEETSSGVRVTDVMGERHEADAVIVAAGPFTQALLGPELPIEVFARTVLFWELGPDDATRLAEMPCLVMEAPNDREPYVLPPIRYPDGKTYIKIGGDPVDLPLTGEAIGEWFRSDGSAEVAAHLDAILTALLPGTKPLSRHRAACAVAFTAHDRPLIDRISPRVVVATAGCARGVKASDELGRLAMAALFGETDPETTLSHASAR